NLLLARGQVAEFGQLLVRQFARGLVLLDVVVAGIGDGVDVADIGEVRLDRRGPLGGAVDQAVQARPGVGLGDILEVVVEHVFVVAVLVLFLVEVQLFEIVVVVVVGGFVFVFVVIGVAEGR